MKTRKTLLAGATLLSGLLCLGQPEPGPLKIDLNDALARARKYGLQVQGAQLASAVAKEDVKQAKAARLPSVSAASQFLYTEGNNTPTGIFVAGNGVHVYTEQAQVHEEVLSLARRGELRLALANEAAARARVGIAARGLTFVVVQSYYALVAAQRKLVNAQTSLSEAERFLDITQKQEKGGEVVLSDTLPRYMNQVQAKVAGRAVSPR